MSADLNGLYIKPAATTPSIVYDTSNVSLISRFVDEISAYRARKQWVAVFHDHFLLDTERDYEITVCPSTGGEEYILSCLFSSACGRYAFWRLINHQAPEAEAALHHSPSSKGKKSQQIVADFGATAEGAEPYLLADPNALKRRRRKDTWYQNLMRTLFPPVG